jgi:hypothetical protein
MLCWLEGYLGLFNDAVVAADFIKRKEEVIMNGN